MRQKITKMLLSMMLAMVCVLNMGIIAYADAEYDSGMTKEEVIAKYTVDTGNEQADKVFNQYLEVASDILVGDKYADFISSVESGDEVYEGFYIACVGGTSADWDAMTTFEKILWYDLYINPLFVISAYSYDKVLTSFGAFSHETCKMYKSTLERYDEALAEAYMSIMEWQYYYIVENSAVYNFITGVDSLGRTEIAEVTQFAMEESVEAAPSEENVEMSESSENVEEIVDTQAIDEPIVEEEEKGIWDDTIQSLKEKWLTFLILGISVIALAGVTIYRKSKAIDDDKVA